MYLHQKPQRVSWSPDWKSLSRHSLMFHHSSDSLHRKPQRVSWSLKTTGIKTAEQTDLFFLFFFIFVLPPMNIFLQSDFFVGISGKIFLGYHYVLSKRKIEKEIRRIAPIPRNKIQSVDPILLGKQAAILHKAKVILAGLL